MRHFKYISTGLAFLMLLFVAACGGGEEAPAVSEEGVAAEAGAIDAELVATGQEIFTGKGICYTCHGAEAAGTQLAPNLTDDVWINLEEPITPEAIAALIRTGVPTPVEHPAPMPPMGGAQLTDQEIEAVAMYVYSLTHG